MPLNDNEQRKLEEARRRAEEEEARRLEEEVARQTEGLRKLRQKKRGLEVEEQRKVEEERGKREEEERKHKQEEAWRHRLERSEEKPGRRDEESLVEKAIQEGGKRKLAAIMFTDIKGFSKKMGENEAAAMEILRIHDATMEKIIDQYGGNVVKSIGDSFMVDFSSAVNAVKCAINVQESFWKYNQGKSEFDEILVRIGIHLGDVITSGKDIFGDGVNIASRIEAIAEPGRICISQDVFHQVKNKMQLQATSTGSVSLKNIAEPIEVFEVIIESIPELAKPSPPVQEALERREREEKTKREMEEAQRAETIQKKAEEEVRRREEELRRRREEEERRRREQEERRRREEEEQQKRREEEERLRKEEEERQRIAEALKKAEEHLAQDQVDAAQAEIDTILSADPMHADALAIDEKIRTAREAAQAQEAERSAKAQAEAEVEIPPTPEEPVRELRKEKAPPAKKPISKGVVLGGIGAIAAVVVGIIIYQVTHALFVGKPYIAVLPFSPASNTAEERMLGIALASETASLLSYVPNARIMGPSTAVNLYRTTRNARIRANQLNFAYTLSGALTMTGTNVALNVEIVDTLGDKIWSGRIEKSFDRLAELPMELSMIAMDAFSLPVPDVFESLSSIPTTNGNAYLSYLRGRELLHDDTYGSVSSAGRLFSQAKQDDPKFAESYAAAAHALYHTYETGISSDPQLLSQAETLGKKALELKPDLSEAHVVLGGVAKSRKEYGNALTSLQRGLELMPGNTDALRLLGIIHTIAGEEIKALEYVSRTYELDPANPDFLTSAALINERFGKSKEAMAYFDQALPYLADTSSYLAGVAGNTLISAYQYDRAITLYERRVALDARNYVDQYKLARAYQLAAKGSAVWSKAFEKTIALIQQELRARPEDALATAYLGLALSRYGRYPEGEASGKRALRLAANSLTIHYKVANIYSIQKKTPEAIDALREAIRIRFALDEIVDLDLFNIGEEPEFVQTISLPLQ